MSGQYSVTARRKYSENSELFHKVSPYKTNQLFYTLDIVHKLASHSGGTHFLAMSEIKFTEEMPEPWPFSKKLELEF